VSAVFALQSLAAEETLAYEVTDSERGPSGTELISSSLIDLNSTEHILDLSGENRPGFPGSYVVSVTVHRLPCLGKHRYVTFGEDLTNGASTSLEAELRIRRISTTPRRLPCGRPLPPQRASLHAWAGLFNAGGQPVTLMTRSRRSDGSFRAILDLAGALECGKPYRFLVRLVGRRFRRVYRYTVDVLAASAGLDNRVERVDSCKLAAHE
jgi:hypothetical protein